MIWPAGKTSIWNRPPLISSTTLASRRAEPWSTSSAGVQSVGILHLNFGWGNDVRGVDDSRCGGDRHCATCHHEEPASFGHHAASAYRDELRLRAFGDVVPGAQ